jgi:hypothetical protein
VTAPNLADVLARSNVIVPQVRAWMDKLIAEHESDAVPVASLGFQRLPLYFPDDLLRATRVAAVSRIPFPPLTQMGSRQLGELEQMSFRAITFGDVIFAHKSSLSSESVMFHELVHVLQWNTLGPDDFLITCGLGLAQHGYAKSPFEALAYDLQSEFDRNVQVRDVAATVRANALNTRAWAAEVFRQHGVPMGA